MSAPSKYDHEAIRVWREGGISWATIAAMNVCPPGVMDKQARQAHNRWLKRQGAEGSKPVTSASVGSRPGVRNPEPPAAQRPAILDELQGFVHPAPFAVTYPAVSPPTSSEVITAVLYGDTHGQYIDPEAEAVFLSVLRDVAPDIVVHVGDLVDAYNLSSFDRDPLRKESLQDEIDAGRTHLARVRAVVPGAHFRLLEGNHEDRLRRTLWRADGPAREVLSLQTVRDAVTWPALLRLDDLGIEFTSAFDQPLADLLPKFILKHGNVVRKWSGWSAKGEWERYGKSGASGHVHRLGMFFHRDWNGNHVWAETGCLCSLNPDYMRDPDWQQGFVVASFERSTGAFQIEPVYIHRGSAVWRGKVYRA
jgi:hypothetical protein